ncbi:MAG: leucine-rich repeat protein, partial [Prevotellaceae bacterium]|nr:leucine-rich repeat protein [Prevotellaceae bacterium]
PSTVTTIGVQTFFGCHSLESIELPSDVESIGMNAFASNENLSKITCHNENPINITDNVFNGIASKAVLYVPAASIETYKADDNWSKDFNEILPIGMVEIADGKAYTNKEDQEVPMVRYTRTFSAAQKDKWQALYIPFSFNVADYAEDFDVAEIYAICPTKDTNGNGVVDAEDDKVMILSFVKNCDTQANAPYMIRPKKAAKVTIESENELLHKATINSVEFSTSRTKYTVNGIYSTFVATPGDHNYYMGGGKVSWATTANISVSPNRWYMHEESKSYIGNDTGIDSESKPISIHVIGEDFDEATAIRLINAEFDLSNSNTGIYNLNGMKMDEAGKLPRGIYIKKGKKMVIK